MDLLQNSQPREEDLAVLKKNFGYEDFRKHQYESISALKEGKNVFLRKSTGGGKSLIYQYLALDAKIIVLSPLVALMDDQCYQAKKYGVRAFCMHSQQSRREREKALKAWTKEKVGLLLCTPERFAKEDFKEAVKKSLPKFFVVDEAHCASQWGHDFRPDYSKVGEIRELLQNPPTLACTATATEKTKQNIYEILSFGSEAPSFEESILRKNLNLRIEETFDFKEKKDQVLNSLSKVQGSTLIYFSLIKNLEKFSSELKNNHVTYHSKLPAKVRRSNQKAFIQGDSELMLATPAFGLGVDKENIRNLIHFELPGSIEAYVQEFGRAGRDGKPSDCTLYYSQEDIQVQMDFIKWGHPDPETIRWLYKQVKQNGEVGFPLKNLMELKKKLNFYNTYDFRLEAALNILLRWECLVKEKGLIKVGKEPLEAVPDMAEEKHASLIKTQQLKLYELIKLLRVEDKKEFYSKMESYFSS